MPNKEQDSSLGRMLPKDLWTEDINSVLKTWEQVAEKLGISPFPEIVSGREHIPEGAHIVTGNHRGWAEVFAILEAWPVWVHFMNKAENFKIPGVASISRKAGSIPVKRGEVDRKALKQARQLLEENKVVAMMFEGTRGSSEESSSIREPKRGVAYVAYTAQVPIVPVAVVGSEKIFPLIDKQSPLKTIRQLVELKRTPEKPGLRMAIGEPITDHIGVSLKKLTRSEQLDDLTQTIVERVGGLIDILEPPRTS